MDTLIRHWHILRMIPRHPRRISAATIHYRLESIDPALYVTRRTIERDLVDLSRLFSLDSDDRRPRGWCWCADAEGLDVPGMDLTAALTFRMVEEYLAKMLPAHCLTALAPHMKRARHVLGEEGAEGLASWPQRVAVVPRSLPLIPPALSPTVLDSLTEALLRCRRCRAVYQPKGEIPREYEFNPLGLVFNDPVIYLVATLWDYTDPLRLALHRFAEVEILEEPFSRPPDFNLQDYVAKGALGFPEEVGRTLRLRALFAPEAGAHLYESPLSSGQKLTERKDGRLLVEAEIPDTPQLRWWLLGFGPQVEILEPQGLREEFAAMARKMTGLYLNKGKPMKTIIAGSRSATSPAELERAITDSRFSIGEVVSGGAKGADLLGERWAAGQGIPIRRFLPEWDKFRKSAGLRRNAEMAQYADALIALWDGKSKGTRHMIEVAEQRGLKIFVSTVAKA